MLHQNSILPPALDILNRVMSDPEYNAFALVGGTALALQIGHRISVDLDFFGDRAVDTDDFFELIHSLGEVRLMTKSRYILVLDVHGIKVDFVHYRYEWLKPPVISGKIRLASLQDIGAMKLAAITGRGRKRDFLDLYFLLKQFSLRDLLKFYHEKYPDGSEFLVLRSLTYFADAEPDDDPKMLIPTDWEKVKKSILQEVRTIEI